MTTTTTTPLAPAVDEAPDPRRWWTLVALCIGLSVISIDNTILNVALPHIVEDTGAQGSQLQWIIDAYIIVFASLLLTSGSLGDRIGRKRVLTFGLVAFGAFSALASTVDTPAALIVCRGLMGIGGAAIFPSTLSILTNTFQGKERARAIGIWAGVAGLGVAIGPLTGGLLLEHFWWGSVFLVNVPICLAALVMGRFLIRETKDPDPGRLDPLGALLSIVGLVGLLYAIIEVPDKGWTSPQVVGPGLVGLAVLAGFALWEARSDHPMLDVTFFKNPRFSAASATVTLTYFALFGSTFLLTQYFQFVLGYSPLKAGMLTAPVAVGLMGAAPRAPGLVDRIGTKRVVVIGLAIVASALLAYGSDTLMSSIPGGVAVRLVFGIGMGFTIAPATESIMGSLPRERAGVGSAVNDTTRQAGGALGVAVIGSIFAARYHSTIQVPAAVPAAGVPAVEDSIGKALEVGRGVPPDVATQIHDAASVAFLDGMRTAVICGAVVIGLAALVSWRWLPAQEAAPEPAPGDDVREEMLEEATPLAAVEDGPLV